MKNRIFLITFITIFSLFLVFFIIGLVMLLTINVNSEIDKISDFAISKNSQKSQFFEKYFDNLKVNSPNKLSFLYFAFGFEGFHNLALIHGSSFAIMAVSFTFLAPIFGLLALFFGLVFINRIIAERFRKEYKYRRMKKYGKYVMYFSAGTFALFMIIGFVLLTVSEQNLINSGINEIFGGKHTDLYNSFNPDSLSYLTILQFGGKHGFYDLIANTSNELFEKNINNLNYSIIIGSLVFLLILSPIAGITMFISTSIWLGTFVCNKNGDVSKFHNWTKNIRIDTAKEYRHALVKNPWFIIQSILYLSALIFPGLIHPYNDLTQVLLSVLSIVSLPIGFLPLFVGYVMVKKLKRFNYNLLMWIQMLILFIIISSLEIIVFVLAKQAVSAPSALAVFWPLIIVLSSTTALFRFVKFKV